MPSRSLREGPSLRLGLAAFTLAGGRILALGFLVLALGFLARWAGVAVRASSPHLLLAIGGGLALVIGGAALGNRAALFVAVLIGVPFELPGFCHLRSERSLLRRQARWLVRFVREKPRGYNTPGGHLAYGVIAVKKLLKRAALRRERQLAVLLALERQRAGLVRRSRWAGRRTFRLLCHADARAAISSRQEHAINTELARIEAEMFRRRLAIQSVVVAGFIQALEEARRTSPISEADYRRVMGELQQPADGPPALLSEGLVRGPRAVAFEYGMFLGRLAMALLFVSTFHTSFLLLSLLLFWLELYVVEPVVFKLHVGVMNLFLDVRGQKMADCRRQIESLGGGQRFFRVPIIVPKFSSNPAASQLAAIIESAIRRAGTGPVRVVPFSMRAGNRTTRLELPEGDAGQLARAGRALRAALGAELRANRARFPLEVEIEQDGREVRVVLADDDHRIWEMIGEDASQAFLYLWKNLRALGDSLSHLGPRFQPVFILASNSKDPDVIQYEIDHLAQLQRWSNTHHRGQVGFLYLLRGGAWYNYNARLRRFDAKDKDFAAAFPGFAESLAAADQPLRGVLPGEARTAEGLAGALNQLLEDPDLYRLFAGFDLDALPLHRQPPATTRALLERRRAGRPLRGRERLALNRELLFTALPMRGSGSFFKKVGNDIAVHELLVAGKTRPTVYTDRRVHEHVQDGGLPNYRQVWGDFARYTGLRGSTAQIQAAILAGDDLAVDDVPEVAAIVDDKNSFAPGELEKGLAVMLHDENRHLVIGVPGIEVTMPEDNGRTISSPYARGVQAARQVHNAADGLTRAGLFQLSSPAFGKWLLRPRAYFAHYAHEALNAAHALSHDFQQSYLVAGAAGRLGALCESLSGPSRFEMSCVVPRASWAEAAVEAGVRIEEGVGA